MKGVAVVMVAMMAMALMVAPNEAITCSDLSSMLSPCLNYLKSGGSPPQACCAGARRVQAATRSQADRRTVCNCAKSAAAQMKIRPDAASSLPGKCRIATSIPINPNVNCNTIP
ncbi:non-specific lipid-transfer protein AP10-like [Cynara cardunculus var. scolymus]|uniref:non-specific lipid-transfer protein AP10-like n=1 Tax=Cynara cardunculus var. scolymus TaxID=59895 RepID=UPI000D62976F|nr:non-specific lipid-transfer protein AP10-like [Cynara cardunculus var. scolymus]